MVCFTEHTHIYTQTQTRRLRQSQMVVSMKNQVCEAQSQLQQKKKTEEWAFQHLLLYWRCPSTGLRDWTCPLVLSCQRESVWQQRMPPPHGSPEVSIWRRCMSEGANDRFEGQKIGKWVTVWWADGIDNKIITEHQATFATSERGFFECNWQMSHYLTFFLVFFVCLFVFLQKEMSCWNFSLILQGNQEQPSRHGWLVPTLLSRSTWMEESLHPHRIITPLAWQWTSSDGSLTLIIAVVAPQAFCVWLLLPWRLILSDYSCCLVFPIIAAMHKELLLFLAGVCHGALSMCKHLCLEVCLLGRSRVCMIIDSSEACPGVIAFAWQARV